MIETDIFNLMMRGWQSNLDPTSPASLESLPDVENFAPTFEGSLVMSKGYVDCGLSIPAVLLGKPVVCLLPYELVNGVSAVIRGGGGGLWLDEIVEVGAVEQDAQAFGYFYA